MIMHSLTLWTLAVFWPAAVWGHARLMAPPSRSSMWRLGFPTKKNFNDNALYCGGIQTQWQLNKGKCGICGDPYNMPHPRDNEAGGKYGKGIISRRYLAGQIMEATVQVTTNHRGYFQFKLCPNNNPRVEATQECLDKTVLKGSNGQGSKYYVADRGNGDVTVKLQLPKDLTCSQCVFQWTYVAGNNWGRCPDGKSGLGCGPQEHFRGCADIAIFKNLKDIPTKPNENDINITRKDSWNKTINKTPSKSNGGRKTPHTFFFPTSEGGKRLPSVPKDVNRNRNYPMFPKRFNQRKFVDAIGTKFVKDIDSKGKISFNDSRFQDFWTL